MIADAYSRKALVMAVHEAVFQMELRPLVFACSMLQIGISQPADEVVPLNVPAPMRRRPQLLAGVI